MGDTFFYLHKGQRLVRGTATVDTAHSGTWPCSVHLQPPQFNQKRLFSQLHEVLSSKCSSSALKVFAAANFHLHTYLLGRHLDNYSYNLFDIYDKAYLESPTEIWDNVVRHQFILDLELGLREEITSANSVTFSDAFQAAAPSSHQLSFPRNCEFWFLPCVSFRSRSRHSTFLSINCRSSYRLASQALAAFPPTR